MVVKYYRLFKEASKLDIFDLAYEYSSESLNILSFPSTNLPRKGIAVRILCFFWHLFRNISELRRRRELVIPGNAFIFFVVSKNEEDSLKPVYNNMPNAYLTGYIGEATNNFKMFWAYMLACIFLPLVVINFLKSKGYKRKSFTYIFDHYWLTYGLYITGRVWLERLKPKAFIVANHINTHNRVMSKAARDVCIPVFYIQHASLFEGVPPLNFDFALLEGYDALNKCAIAGATQAKVFLVGIPKHDLHFHHINVQPKVHSIGICTNGLDPIPRAKQLCKKIRQEFPTLPISIRLHLADRRVKEWKDMATRFSLEFSDSKTELSFDFLKKVDAIISGDSNILLEAALMDVFPMFYDFSDNHLDWYGFLRNGLVEYSSEPDEICMSIRKLSQNKPSIRIKAKRYCATVSTRYDGHSSELASMLIQAFVSGNQVNLCEWKRIPGIELEAYELNYGGELTAID